MFFWIVLDQLHYSSSWLGVVAWLWAVGTIVLTLVGLRWKEKQRRSLMVVAIASIFGYLPLVATCVVIGFSYLFFLQAEKSTVLALQTLLVAVIIWWCVREVAGCARRVVERRFVEREFNVEDDRIVFRRPHRTDLDAPPVSEKSMLGKIYYGVVPRMVVLLPLAYPLQRLLTDTGGVSSFSLLMSLLTAPLAIYALGRLSSGAYLYIYKTRQLELLHHKPVVFEQA